MRDSSLGQYIAELDYELTGIPSPTYLYLNVLSFEEAQGIQRAADLAFLGRWGEAEHARIRAGYDGLGLLDDGPVKHGSESARHHMRRALDDEA